MIAASGLVDIVSNAGDLWWLVAVRTIVEAERSAISNVKV